MQSSDLLNIEGIVISSRPYKERGAILELLTPLGAVTIFGSSFKSPKSKYHVLNNLFLKVNIAGYMKDNKIFKLKDYNVVSYDFVNKFSLSKAEFLFKIIKLIRLNEHNSEDVYNLFTLYLENIDIFVNYNTYYYYFVCLILKDNNIIPDFENCAVCKGGESFVTFSINDGGLICKNCYNNQYLFSVEDIKKMKMLFNYKNEDYFLNNIDIINKIILTPRMEEDIKYLLNESIGIYV